MKAKIAYILLEAIRGLHAELTLHWPPGHKQQVMTALVDTGAECTLIHGNPQKLSGPLSTTDGYRGQIVTVRKVPLTL